MTQSNVCLVVLATAWGARHGGINAFNAEWVRSIGIAPLRTYRLACVVPSANEADRADAERHHVMLVPLRSETDEMPASHDVLAALRSWPGLEVDRGTVVWIGHDDKTGPLALDLREMLIGSRAVLVNHMAYGAYQDAKKDGGGADKWTAQKLLFSQADQCLAVGPMLADHLRDSLSSAQSNAVTMLVPGLVEPDSREVSIRDHPPKNFVAFLGGRLGSDDERIKQALLGVRGFGRALGQALAESNNRNALMRSPSLRMRGVPSEQHCQVRKALEVEARVLVACDLKPYIDDRQAYFRDLASSSVALMPSWHEGFGLVAWEAIACQVPVVIGKQSGIYRLLDGEWQGAGLGRSVRAIQIDGFRAEVGDSPHTECDVVKVAEQLFDLGKDLVKAKTDAVTLAQRLRASYSWKDCAASTLRALGVYLDLALLKSALPPDGPPIDDDGGTLPIRSHSPTPSDQGDGPMKPAPQSEVPDFLRPPAPQLAAQALQIGPSALLAARDQWVSFHSARDSFVDSLLTVLTSPSLPRLTLQCVYGPGGAGKTRSALELLKQAAAQGWAGLWLHVDLPTEALDAWRTQLATSPYPQLLVVDYAEGREPELLLWLRAALEDALDRPDAPRVHLLCLSRTVEWWGQLARQPGCGTRLAGLLTSPAANLGMIAVPDWPEAPADRADAFNAALHAYAAALGEPLPDYPWNPDFRAADYARPLYLHMAALAALAGERPSHSVALLTAQLRREWQFWQRRAPATLACAEAWEDWVDGLALLAQTQGLEADALSDALKKLGIARHSEMADALARIYPRVGGGAGALTPDLLAEHVIIERLATDRAPIWLALAFHHDEVRLTRALEVLARLAARVWSDGSHVAGQEPPTQIQKRLMEALVDIWPTRGQHLVDAVHHHGIALRSPVVDSWRALSPAVQNSVAPRLRLPEHSTPLLGLTVQIRRCMVKIAADDPSRVGAMTLLSNALAALGDPESRIEALEIAREVVRTRCSFAKFPPEPYLAGLALSLDNLANRLHEQGDFESRVEALDSARKAMEIYSQLAKAAPMAYLPDLALSLNNVANHLSELGGLARRGEALRNARKSTKLYARLARTKSGDYLPDLARSFHNLANRWAEQSSAAARIKAVANAREAVRIRNSLAKAQAGTYLPVLAMSLDCLANNLAMLGDTASVTEALAFAREAVAIYRKVSRAEPWAYQRGLVISLNNLANTLSIQGDPTLQAEARCTAQEAFTACSALHMRMPSAFDDLLRTCIQTLARLDRRAGS